MNGQIIIFRLPKKAEQKFLNQFCKKFYGQYTSSHRGRYRYWRKGLLDSIPHRRLIRGVVIMKREDAKIVMDFLEEFNAEVHVREIVLTLGDEVALGMRS